MSRDKQGAARPVFVLRVQSLRGDDIRALRRALKALLRRLGLRCIAIEEASDDA